MMSPRTTSRSLQRGHGHRTPGWVRGGVAVAAGQQPLDGANVVLERNVLRIDGGGIAGVACGEPDVVTEGFESGFDGPTPRAGGGQQRDRGGMQQGPGLGAHGHHVPHQQRPQFAAPQQRMLLDEAPGAVHGVGEEHGLEPGVPAARQLAQLVQQSLEPFSVEAQTFQETGVGHFAGIQHTGRRGDRREPVADGMCQCAQQLVMYTEPSFGADVGLTNLAH